MFWWEWAGVARKINEKRKERDARRQKAAVRAARRRAALPTPRDRAAALLWSLLDPKQRRSLIKSGWFEVESQGRRIRFSHGNLRPQEVDKAGEKVIASFCVYVSALDGCNTFHLWEDHAIGLTLLLRYWPKRFHEVAVVHHDFIYWHQVPTTKWKLPTAVKENQESFT